MNTAEYDQPVNLDSKTWEITAGRKGLQWVNYKSAKWWVLTWRRDHTGKKIYSSSPILVVALGDGRLAQVVSELTGPSPNRPSTNIALDWGWNTLPGGDRVHHSNHFYLDQKHVWARMPAQVPEPPNVEPIYDTPPWEEGERT